ncbi:hypothetical protein [Aquibacillus sediminis]|uniref:hypothetical protein n=1 Tax=Aquibacillus sediminis TaxID=2574734 RepID=UPI0011080904|nr:hypothetical protein [Aquibacillus sediminis]
MEITKSRKERLQASNRVRPSKKKGSSVAKKFSIIVLAMSLFFGGTAAYAAINPAFLTQLSNFANSVFASSDAELVTTGESENGATVSDLGTFLEQLKTKIQTQITGHADVEKERIGTEVTEYNDSLQTEADSKASTEIEAKKAELTETANTQITTAQQALDAKFNEIFPETTTE